MQRIVCTLLSLLLSTVVDAQPSTEALQKSLAPFSYSMDDTTDKALAFLSTVLKDKRIVFLGESSHGIGDYYTLKSRIIPYLHDKLGFEVLAIESGIADVFLEFEKLDTISGEQLRNRTIYGNFQCLEILPLFRYIKNSHTTQRPLLYSGFDSQNFGSSLQLTYKMLQRLIPASADSLIQCINSYYRIPPLLWQEDKTPLVRLGDSILSATSTTRHLIESNTAFLQSEFKVSPLAFRYLLRGLRNLEASMSLDWTRESPVAKRDSLMADNLFWLMDSIYPGKKVIVWGHNGHIEKSGIEGSSIKWMGHFVKERYGDKAYHIGLFAKEGATYEWWTRTNKTFSNNQSDDLEQLLAPASGNIRFIDLLKASKVKANNILKRNFFAFELENGGRLRFSPAQRFDGVIVFRSVSLPNYK